MKNIIVVAIIGISLIVFSFVLTMTQGHAEANANGRYQTSSHDNGCYVIDSQTGNLWNYHWASGWEYIGRPTQDKKDN